MATLVLTLIGDDRAGLVSAVADVVARHGGNWERSELAELAGKFAGIVQVAVPDANVQALADALEPLKGTLDITVVAAADVAPTEVASGRLSILGTDRSGIVHQITAVLAANDVSIVTMRTETRDAPMAGGRLFEALADLQLPASADVAAIAAALEALTNELLVDIDFTAPS